jgi:hypothetical protein
MILIFVLVMMGLAIGWLAKVILGRRDSWVEALEDDRFHPWGTPGQPAGG